MDLIDDTQKWVVEAEAIVNDLKHYVKEIAISNSLPNSSTNIYLNVQTLENEKYCIELYGNGFRIVGNSYDLAANDCDNTVYETPQSLLSSISKGYMDSFSKELHSKLVLLKRNS